MPAGIDLAGDEGPTGEGRAAALPFLAIFLLLLLSPLLYDIISLVRR